MGMLRRPILRLARPRVHQGSKLIQRKQSSWVENVSRPSNDVQIYVSKTDDPYLNLSIEHFFLQTSPPKSCILFLYVNRPCIVIGRNQNPWYEVNLNILNGNNNGNARDTEPSGIGKVDLVRRRSGGGTVFHDYGNVNWTVISPSNGFTRDKHAEMVVRALRSKGVDRARVNERHDIVLDRGSNRHEVANDDFHRTPWTSDNPNEGKTVKVSGSAYKLTRGRALHHGTCLLSSPNLNFIPQYLHSPGKPFIKAKGVESVSSPVSNVGLDTQAFHEAVIEEFSRLYVNNGQEAPPVTVGDETLQVPAIKAGWDEIQTPEWKFDQTPQFTFQTHPEHDDAVTQSGSDNHLPPFLNVYLNFRHCRVTSGFLSVSGEKYTAGMASEAFAEAIGNRRLHETWNWHEAISNMDPRGDTRTVERASQWLQRMLPSTLFRLLP